MSEKKVKDVKVTEDGEVVKLPYWKRAPKRKFEEDPDIVHFYEKDVVKKIGDGEDDFVVDKKVVEYERYNLSDYVQSHSNDVGVKNMIAKAIRNGESADYVLSEKFKSPQKGFVDQTEIEKALTDPDMFSKKVAQAVDKIPGDIKKSKTPREIAKMSDAEIEAYIDGLIEKKFAKKSEVKNESEEIKK